MFLGADRNQDDTWRGNGKAFRGRRKTIFETQFSNDDSNNVFNEEFKRLGSEHYTKQSDVNEIQLKDFKIPSSEQVKKAFASPSKVVRFAEKNDHLENVVRNKPINECSKSFSNQNSPIFHSGVSTGFGGRSIGSNPVSGLSTGFGNKQFGSGANNIPVSSLQSGNRSGFSLQSSHNDNSVYKARGLRQGEYNNRESSNNQNRSTNRSFGGNNSFISASIPSGFGAKSETSKQGFKPFVLNSKRSEDNSNKKEAGGGDAGIKVIEPKEQFDLSMYGEPSSVIEKPKQNEVEPTVGESKQKEVEPIVEKSKQEESKFEIKEPKQVDVQMKSDGSIVEESKEEDVQAKVDNSPIDLEEVEAKNERENSQALGKTDKVSAKLDKNVIDLNANDLLQKLFISIRDGKFEIVKFNVGDNIVNISKIHLSAQSPVFERLMQENSEESKTIYIDNLSLEAVKQFANYIHFGKIENLDGLDIELLKLAKMYEVNELKNICEKNISSNALSNENIFQRLVGAFKAKNQVKKEIALDYVTCKDGKTKNIKEIIASDEWHKLTQENFGLAYEICIAVIKKL